jgi:hypothetical protein
VLFPANGSNKYPREAATGCFCAVVVCTIAADGLSCLIFLFFLLFLGFFDRVSDVVRSTKSKIYACIV